MPRKTIRVEIPTKKPEAFSKLLNDVLKKHTLLGAESPLNGKPNIDMESFGALLSQADGLRDESKSLRKQSEEKMQAANNVYGTGKGQNVDTPGTLAKMLDDIKDTLLLLYKGNEEALGTFGFNVVVGQAKSPKPKNKAA